MHHLPRTLSYVDDKGTIHCVRECELLALPKPLVILGEPGLGKTWILRNLARQPGFELISAAKLVSRPASALNIPDGCTLLIDGLDELSAMRDTDPVCRVIGKLAEASHPPFVLSCRAAEWNGAVARQDIADDYDKKPRQLWVDPFSRETALEFLGQRLEPAQAEALIQALEDKSLEDLFGNPLSLELFAEVTRSKDRLPETRAELIEKATRLMWRDLNDRQDGSPLAALDEATALDAAGAICAALVLTGAEAISLRPSSAGSAGCIHIPDLRSLPGGEQARAVLGSRLFSPVPDADDRYKPSTV
jgi:hypothetical protein